MAIISSKSYRILDARTVSNILTSKLVQTQKYPHIRSRFFDIKSTTQNKVLVTVKNQYSSNIEKIFDNVAELFSVDVLLGNKKVFVTSDKSETLGIDYQLSLQQNVRKVVVLFKASKAIGEKVPELLRPGVLNEEYFVSKINDQIEKIKEAKKQVNLPSIFSPVLDLVLFENNKEKYSVGPIKSIERVGQELGKSDVLIKTTKNKSVNISLKKENFSFWSSAEKYDKGKKVLDYLTKANLIQVSTSNNRGSLVDASTGEKLNGIRIPATIKEIKKYCFGEGRNKIDYILVESFEPGEFKEMRTSGKSGVVYKMEVNSDKIYTETTLDIVRLKEDVYFCITPSSKTSSGLGGSYSGFKLNFMNKKASEGYYEPNLSNVKL